MKILFVHSSVKELLESTNEDTIGIEYHESTSTSLLMETLTAYPNVDRVGFAFHFGQTFMNQEALFSDSDLLPNAQYSRNVQFIIDLIRNYSLVHLDFLACSTLLDERWKQFYAILHLETGVVVGASDNNTGNLKYGGDWIMESTQEDVSQIYFNDSIVNFAKVLVNFDDGVMRYSYTVGFQYAILNQLSSYISPVKSTLTSYTIPSVVNGYIVSQINFIEDFPQLAELIIPDSVTLIGSISSCPKLVNLNIPSSVIQINYLNGNGFTSFRMPSTVLSTPYSILSGNNKLTFIDWETDAQINDYACSNCPLLSRVLFRKNMTFTSMVSPEDIFNSSGLNNIYWKGKNIASFRNASNLSRICLHCYQGGGGYLLDTVFYGTASTLILTQFINSIYYKYTGPIPVPNSRNSATFQTNLKTFFSFSGLYVSLGVGYSVSCNKSSVSKADSFTLTFVCHSELPDCYYQITGVTSDDLSNASLGGWLAQGTTNITYTVAKNVNKIIKITLINDIFITIPINFKPPRKLGIGMKTRLQQFF